MTATVELFRKKKGRAAPNPQVDRSLEQQDPLDRLACSRRLLQQPDSLAERGGFEPPVPLGLTWAEFGPSLAHYSARIKASVLERICSPGVRLCFGSLRFPSFTRLMLGIW